MSSPLYSDMATFKTLYPDVVDAKTLDDVMHYPVGYQYMFSKRSTPWDEEDFDKFKLNLLDVDRLYHFYCYEDDMCEGSWEIIVRLIYKEKPLYLEMSASCDSSGFDCIGGGHLYFSRNPNLFFQCVLNSSHDRDRIYKFLKEDGIQIENYDPSDRMHRFLQDTIKDYEDAEWMD